MSVEFNIADVFADLWIEIETSSAVLDTYVPPSDSVAQFERAQRFLSENLADPSALRRLLPKDIEGRLFIAQAVDEWIRPITELDRVSDIGSALAEYRRHYLMTGRLNNDLGRGQVIFRRPLSGRWSDRLIGVPEGLGASQFFENLILLPAHINSTDPNDRNRAVQVNMTFLRVANADFRALELGNIWRVGFAAIAEAEEDVVFKSRRVDGHVWYDAIAEDKSDVIEGALEQLISAECNIIAFPEMVMHPASMERIAKSLARMGIDHSISLVLAGTFRQRQVGSTMPLNQAAVFNHRGEILFRQSKLSRWNLAPSLCGRYDLEEGDPVAFEYIVPGEEVVVVELPGVGRLAVLICEDLARSEPGNWLRRHMLLDLQFTPVMDASLAHNRWSATDGARAARTGNTRIIVSNSLPLSLRQNRVNVASGATHPLLTECAIGMGIDFDSGEVAHRLATVPLPASGPSVSFFDWEPSKWLKIIEK